MNCPTFEASFEAQLPQKYGAFNCTPTSASRAGSHATCGSKPFTGEKIRALSNEPVPDPRSPGLNLPQVALSLSKLGVELEVCVGARADSGVVVRSVTWDTYEERRMAGRGCVLQISYAPIADSPLDAGRGFRGGHAIFESLHSTYDPLADGRAAGVFRFDGRVYPRDLIREAAFKLPIPLAGGGMTHPKAGYVWAAFTQDVVPPYEVRIMPLPGQTFRKVAVYGVKDGYVVSYRADRTKGTIDRCSPPQFIRDRGQYRQLSRIETGPRAGQWVWGGFAHPLGG